MLWSFFTSLRLVVVGEKSYVTLKNDVWVNAVDVVVAVVAVVADAGVVEHCTVGMTMLMLWC